MCLVENGVDGLQFTRSWLARSVDCIKTRQLASESASAASTLAAESEASASSSTPASSSTANAVINAAFLELLDWDDDRVFPEVISTPSLTLTVTVQCTDPVGLATRRASSLKKQGHVYCLLQCGGAGRPITLDLSSSRIQTGALGHTLTPFWCLSPVLRLYPRGPKVWRNFFTEISQSNFLCRRALQ